MKNEDGRIPQARIEGWGRRGVGLSSRSSPDASAKKRAAGHAPATKSTTVSPVECQSPATERPRIAPAADRSAASRIPEAVSRSTVTCSETPASASRVPYNAKRASVERIAENTTTHHPGPSPTFPPAKQNVIPNSAPVRAIVAA
jgi:hypothetical protein